MSSPAFRLPWPRAGDQFLLRPDVTFLNHGSFGATPRPVFDAYQRWQRELEAEPVEFLGRRLPDLLAAARAPLAAMVGASPDDLVFIPNATFGVNIVARSLDLQPGDEVLATDHEYGAAERAWRFNCEKRGARYVAQPIHLPIRDEGHVIEQLWAGVGERTRVIFLSHITSPTAVIFPVADICRRAREAGILTVVDAAHAPGHIDLNLAEIGADFYLGNCHKWLSSARGAGFMHARPDTQALLEPLVVSWGWRSEWPSTSTYQDWYGWTGTDDPSAYLSVPDAIRFQREHDWPAARAECHALVLWARERAAAISGLPPICPDRMVGQMAVLPLPPGALERLGARLWDEYRIEIPHIRWQSHEFLRLSIQAYNSEQDVTRLLDAVAALI